MWESDQCIETPFFKVHENRFSDAAGLNAETPPPFPSPYSTKEGPNGVGGLAYTIEATESLSLATRFNAKHSLEPEVSGQFSVWLNKFRQLDSRLMQ